MKLHGHMHLQCPAEFNFAVKSTLDEIELQDHMKPLHFCFTSTHDVINCKTTCNLWHPAPYLIQQHVFTTNKTWLSYWDHSMQAVWLGYMHTDMHWSQAMMSYT